MGLLAFIPFCYLMGSIPSGFWVGRWKGIDIRKHGSGNIGFTNVYRVMGPLYGSIVFIADFLKGYLAVSFTQAMGVHLFGVIDNPPQYTLKWIMVLSGIAAIAGHNWSIFLGFKGGKGVLTSAGVFMALSPFATGITMVFFVMTVAFTHYISVGSLVSAVLLPFLSWNLSDTSPILALSVLAGILIFYTHRANIRRLMEGKENVFSLGKARSTIKRGSR